MDNVKVNAPTSDGATIATDDVGGVQHQLVKIEFGIDGVATRVSTSNKLPVDTGLVQYVDNVSTPLTVVGTAIMYDAGGQLRVPSVNPLSGLPVQITGVDSVGGQALMAASLPVVIASNQTAIPLSNAKLDSLIVTAGKLQVELPAGGAGLTNAELRLTPVPVSVSNLPATQAISAVALPLPTGAAIAANQQTNAITDAQLRATALPISAAALPLPTGAALEAGNLASIKLKTDNIPSQGQALAAASSPVVLTAAQIVTLTPPAAIAGFATSAKQDLLLTELQLKADLLETQPVSLASVPTHPVTNAGTFAVQAAATLAAETTKVIGTVNVAGTIPISGALTDTQLRATAVPVTANAGTNLNTSALSLEATQALIKLKTDNIPAQGQALAAASLPVVLTAAQIITLTPPAQIAGFALAANQQTNAITDVQIRATALPVSIAAVVPVSDNGGSLTVDGTFFQATQPVSIAAVVPVSGSFFQATQPVSGTFFQATQPVSGTFFQATQPVSLATNTPDVTDRAARLLGVVASIAGALPAGANAIGNINELRAATLAVTVTAATGTAATLTIPAVAAQFHYITSIEARLYSTAARVGAAAPILVTTTNIPGTPSLTFDTAGAIGTSVMQQPFVSAMPLRSLTVNTATTIVAPIVIGGIWRITATYFTAV